MGANLQARGRHVDPESGAAANIEADTLWPCPRTGMGGAAQLLECARRATADVPIPAHTTGMAHRNEQLVAE